MPKYIDPETKEQILRMLAERKPKVEIRRQLSVSDEYLRQFRRKHAKEIERLRGEHEETPLQAYERFSARENLRHRIESVFDRFQHLLLEHATKEVSNRGSKIKVWLNKRSDGVDVDFMFDGPGGEVWVPREELHNFLLSEYLAEAWVSVYNLFLGKKKKALELSAETTNFEQAQEVVNKFVEEINREIIAVKRAPSPPQD